MATINTVNSYFEDFQVGDVFITARRTVTETDLVVFSGLSGDYSPHHTDAIHAAESSFGQRIAHGALILSIATGLEFGFVSPGDRIVAFYGMDRVRFVKPVLIGDTIHLRGEIAELAPKDEGRGVVTIQQSILNQHGDTVTVLTKRLLVARKPQ